MKNIQTLWIVMRQEFLLLARGWAIWVIGGIIALLGIIEALAVRAYPLSVWNNVLVNTFLVALLLTIVSGEQAYVDHEFGVERLIWSTPVGTITYFCGKYLSSLCVALGFILLHLLLAILVDKFYPAVPAMPTLPLLHSILGASYPGLGAQAYLIWSVWYILAPTLFGTALAFAVTNITRGQRIISHILATILWLTAYLGGLPVWLDTVGGAFLPATRGCQVWLPLVGCLRVWDRFRIRLLHNEGRLWHWFAWICRRLSCPGRLSRVVCCWSGLGLYCSA